jgi:hypothetical protein
VAAVVTRRRKTLPKNREGGRSCLTPTGLLMEGAIITDWNRNRSDGLLV